MISFREHMGGVYADFAMAGDLVVKPRFPRLLHLDPNGSNRDVTLPDAREMKGAGNRFLIVNHSTTETLAVKDADGTTIATVGSGSTEQAAILALSENATRAGRWLAVVRDVR